MASRIHPRESTVHPSKVTVPDLKALVRPQRTGTPGYSSESTFEPAPVRTTGTPLGRSAGKAPVEAMASARSAVEILTGALAALFRRTKGIDENISKA